MNERYCAQVLAVMVATWPTPEWPKDHIQAWLAELRKIPDDDAPLVEEAVDLLRRREDFRPSIARFLDALRCARRRHRPSGPNPPSRPSNDWLDDDLDRFMELSAPPAPKEVARRRIAEIRADLRAKANA